MEAKSNTTEYEYNYELIDILKLICSIFVVVIHCEPLKDISTIANEYITEGICRIAVPLFFCISGFLLKMNISMCNTRQDIFFLIRKQEKSYLKLYLTWSVIYFVFNSLWQNNFSLKYVLYQIWLLIFRASNYHFWYIVALIYALPIVCFFIIKIKNNYIKYGIIIGTWTVECFCFSYRKIIPSIGNKLYLFSHTYDALYNTIFCALPLLLLGTLCYENYKKVTRKKWKKCLMITFGALLLEKTILYSSPFFCGQSDFMLTTPIVAYCVLNCALCSNFRLPNKEVSKVLRKLSTYVYCLHPMFISIIGIYTSAHFVKFIIVLVLSFGTSILIYFGKKYFKRLSMGEKI